MKKILRTLLVVVIVIVGEASSCLSQDAKPPNVSGQFYSADPQQLSSMIDDFLAAAEVKPLSSAPKIIIVPHAGYVYSGNVAAYGYQAAKQGHYRTVIIVGVSHFTDFEGMAIWPKGRFQTPLGSLFVDEELAETLMATTETIKPLPRAFEEEHSLEVQLPFVQKIFQNTKIVPLLTGRPNFENCRQLALALNKAIGSRDDVLIVISTDFSHYHDDATARPMDLATLELIKNLDVENLWNRSLTRESEMCGFVGVATALLYAKLGGLNSVEVLRYANSADVTLDKSRVVGYASVAFFKESENPMKNDDTELSPLNIQQKKSLLDIAQKAAETYIQTGKIPDIRESDPRLQSKEGAFVTIHKHGQLRGCIGHIVGETPLYLTVRNMAVASATRDPRFSPVGKTELSEIDFEISVLSVPKRISDPTLVEPGIHGVIVSRGAGHQGVFLPQVATEQGWSREEFLSNLCAHKAGLPPDCWKDPKTTLEIFTADVFSKKDLP